MVTIVDSKVTRKQIILNCLETLQAKSPDNRAHPEDLVEEAKPVDHPLHAEFDWNNETAGHQHRLTQARQLIRQFEVEIIRDNRPPQKMRGYISLIQDRHDGGGYRSMKEIVADEDLMVGLEQTFKSELNVFLQKWEVLQDLVASVRAAAKITPKTAKKRKRSS